jgi:hypothetical protein
VGMSRKMKERLAVTSGSGWGESGSDAAVGCGSAVDLWNREFPSVFAGVKVSRPWGPGVWCSPRRACRTCHT